MTIKVVILDLDDTLYDELDYVRSGLRWTANVLSERFGWDYDDLERQLLQSLKVSRDKVFDRVLTQKGMLTDELLNFCVRTYREHWPNIRLPNRTKRLLKQLAKEYSLYVVTDGHAEVQETKLKVLGLTEASWIKNCYATYRLGNEYAKPSSKCFEMIRDQEGCKTEDVVTIGDNPDKDFVGLKPLGFNTIRLLQGQHKEKKTHVDFEAEYRVQDLAEAIKLIATL